MRSLSHHMDLEWLHEAYRRTRKDGAAGIDGVTATDFASDLDANLQSLLDRAKSGAYRAPPVRRAEIPKPGGKVRPIGIPTFADKVLQRAVVMLLEPIYEGDFYDFSYGFRPGRSAHDAYDALRQALWEMKGGWVLDADVSSFFDTLDHKQLREMVGHRVVDGVVVRLIGKWLKAGVLSEGRVRHPTTGTPQGGVISPLLANIYLHEVLDRWWVEEVLPRMRGRAVLIRYADDFVMAFSEEGDARRVHAVLPKRLSRFGLTLHPEKTRLVPFQRPGPGGGGRPRATCSR
jgi:group II intron reverse transcriptase/maturase